MKKQFGFKPLLIFVFIFSFFAFAFTKLSVIGTFKTDAPFSSALTTASQVEVSDEGSLTEALSKLESSRADEPVTINFNLSIGAESANKTIELSSGYAIFTGKITSSVADPIFKLAPTSSENSFEFNLELSSTAEEGKDLAILLDNGEEVGNTANISFGANLKTDYKNLLNFTRWAIITIPVSTDFVTETPLGIVCPYDIGDKIIVNNYSGSYADKIKIVSTNPELYSIETQVNGGKLLVRASNVNIKFINNNGTENTKNQTFNYNSANFDFPTEVDETYDHHHFAGWFAKVQVKGSTYYVENTEDSIEALEAEETTVLKTALDEVNKENCFTSCVNNSENLCMRVLNYFLEHDLVPTFELLWEDDQYTVTYDAGDGLFDDEQHIASSSGKFGDDITPPRDPTRYGYNFAGWKLDGDDTEFDQTTFETNYNVHAEWVAKRYSIDLYSSKDDAAPWRNLTFTFGQQELSLPTDITKEGYTFSGDWYTADERLFDIYTMLDEFEETDSITKFHSMPIG